MDIVSIALSAIPVVVVVVVAKTGTRLGGMIDAFANTDAGKMLMGFVQSKKAEG